jgi:hypothetical protein
MDLCTARLTILRLAMVDLLLGDMTVIGFASNRRIPFTTTAAGAVPVLANVSVNSKQETGAVEVKVVYTNPPHIRTDADDRFTYNLLALPPS